MSDYLSIGKCTVYPAGHSLVISDYLSIGKCTVYPAGHSLVISLSLRRSYRGADKLPFPDRDLILLAGLAKHLKVI